MSRRIANKNMFRKRSYTLRKTGNIATSPLEYVLNDSSDQNAETDFEENTNNTPRLEIINYKPYLGLFYCAMCSLLTMLSFIIVKKLNYIDPGQHSLVRNTATFAGSLPIAVYCVKNILGPKKSILPLLTRSLVAATAMYLNLLAYRYLPLAEAAVLAATIPAVVTLIARLYLKEPCGWMQMFDICITVLGVLVSIRIPEVIKDREHFQYTTSYITGLACAVTSVILLSATFVVLREMKDIHFAVVLIYSGVVGMIENATLTASISTFSQARCGLDAFLEMMAGVLGFAGHIFLILAVQVEAAGLVSVTKASVDIIASLIFQVIFFDLSPDLYNVTGASLVILSMILIGVNRWIANLPEDSVTRKRMKFLLL